MKMVNSMRFWNLAFVFVLASTLFPHATFADQPVDGDQGSVGALVMKDQNQEPPRTSWYTRCEVLVTCPNGRQIGCYTSSYSFWRQASCSKTETSVSCHGGGNSYEAGC